MRTIVASMLVVLMAACTSALAYSIDGSNTDWTAKVADAPADKVLTNSMELLYWGAALQYDSGSQYIYGYFEVEDLASYSTDSEDYFFAMLMLDLDRGTGSTEWVGGTRNSWQGPSMIKCDLDNLGPELNYPTATGTYGAHYITPDIEPEWGYQREGWNYWGALDDAWGQGGVVGPNSDLALSADGVGGNADFAEYRISVAGVRTELSNTTNYPDQVTERPVWKVAGRMAGKEATGTNWESDKSGDGDDPGGSTYQHVLYLPVSTLWGDADESLTVNGVDLNAVLGNWNKVGGAITVPLGGIDGWSAGDFDGNEVVNGVDLNTVLGKWNQTYVGGGGSPIPEPMTMSLLVAGAALLIKRRRA